MKPKKKLYCAPYAVLVRCQNRMNRLFQRHALDWLPQEVSETDDDGHAFEFSGVLIGTKDDLRAFFMGAGWSQVELRRAGWIKVHETL